MIVKLMSGRYFCQENKQVIVVITIVSERIHIRFTVQSIEPSL